MNEVTMYLKGKKYRRFVGWLLADRAKHWKEYDANGSGTMEHSELSAAIGGSSADCTFWRQEGYTQPESLYELSCSTADGAPFDFGCLRGKVVICVNVASL